MSLMGKRACRYCGRRCAPTGLTQHEKSHDEYWTDPANKERFVRASRGEGRISHQVAEEARARGVDIPNGDGNHQPAPTPEPAVPTPTPHLTEIKFTIDGGFFDQALVWFPKDPLLFSAMTQLGMISDAPGNRNVECLESAILYLTKALERERFLREELKRLKITV